MQGAVTAGNKRERLDKTHLIKGRRTPAYRREVRDLLAPLVIPRLL